MNFHLMAVWRGCDRTDRQVLHGKPAGSQGQGSFRKGAGQPGAPMFRASGEMTGCQ